MAYALIRNDVNTIVSLKLRFTSHIDSTDCYDRIRSVAQGLGLATPARADVQQLHPNIILIKKMSCSPSIFQKLKRLLVNPSPDEKARFVPYNLDAMSLVSKELADPKQTLIPQQIGVPITPSCQVPPTGQVPPKANYNLRDRITSTPKQTLIPQQAGIPITPPRPPTSQAPPKANYNLRDRTTSTVKQTPIPQQAGIPITPPRPPSQVPPKASSSLQDRTTSTPKQTLIPQQVGIPITLSRPLTSQVSPINQAPPKANSSLQDRATSTPEQTLNPLVRQQVGIPVTPSRPPTSQIPPKANSSLQARSISTPSSVPMKVAQTQPTLHIPPGADAKTHTTVRPSQPSNESETLPSPAPSQRKRTLSDDEKDVGPLVKRLKVAEPGQGVESVPLAKYLVLLQHYADLKQKQKPLQDTISELRATLENREQKITSTEKALEAEKFRSKTLVQEWNAKKGEMLNLKAAHQKEIENFKQELASEHHLRLQAEKLEKDIRREMTHPFIVPGLIDAFIIFSQGPNGVPEDSSVSPTDTAGTM